MNWSGTMTVTPQMAQARRDPQVLGSLCGVREGHL